MKPNMILFDNIFIHRVLSELFFVGTSGNEWLSSLHKNCNFE